jgi:hypothetical protein
MPFELIVGAVVGAAATTKPVRRVVRQGVVYGLAGLLVAYDKMAALTSGVVDGVRQAAATPPEALQAPAPAGQAQPAAAPATAPASAAPAAASPAH